MTDKARNPDTAPGAGGGDRLLASRVSDAFEAAGRQYVPRFVGFLDGHQRRIAQQICDQQACGRRAGECSALFWGGFEGAERTVLGVFPPFGEPETAAFPIRCVRIGWKFRELTHRDFLGSLLSLGIRRDKIGDIVVGDGECAVMLDEAVACFVMQNLEKVGGAGVRCEEADGASVHVQAQFDELSDTVASPRLDCVVASLGNMSRTESGRLITNGLISVDFETVMNSSAPVCEGSTVSIRGHGRFIIDAIGPATRKGRLKFSARRYR